MGKTKTNIVVIALMSLMLAVPALAIGVPAPMSGRIINTGYVGDIPVKITDIDSSRLDSTVVFTDSEGWFVTEWTNLGYTDIANGDRIEICVGNTVCRHFVFNDILNAGDIDIIGLVPPKEKTCPTLPTQPTCPSVPSYPEPVVCPAPPTCLECQECPEPTDSNSAINILLGVLGGLGAGVAAVYIKLGKTAQHLHKGIANYHSIYTSHTNTDIRHTRGQIAPKYVQIDGKWKYQGD